MEEVQPASEAASGIRRETEHLEKKITDLQERLLARIEQKTGELVNTLNEMLQRLLLKDEDLSNQITGLRLSCADYHGTQYNKLSETTYKLQSIEKSLARNIERLMLAEETIEELKGRVSVSKNQVNTLKEKSQEKPEIERQQSAIDALNISQKFATKLEPNKLAITYLAGDFFTSQWRGFIRNLALPLNQVTTCQIRQTKTAQEKIMTGIATNVVFGTINPHKNTECLAYYSIDGDIYENGYYKKGGRAVSDGEVIAIRVDTANWQIKWSVGSQQLAATTIPQQMRKKSLYIVVIMGHQNDAVEMLLD